MSTTFSVLDLLRCFDEPYEEVFARSIALACDAERYGYHRLWYAEHHNLQGVASSSPAIMIAAVGARTSRIRLGAGGVMLPNHAPFLVAEQFGALARLYPSRIDLGLGRAPGTDPHTLSALRRPTKPEHFLEDLLELRDYFSDKALPIQAVPAQGTKVPLFVLGSSLFGAQVAAQLGLPYAFASHFAPTHLEAAVATYREQFQPQQAGDRPYVIAGFNVLAADTTEEAQHDFQIVARAWVRRMVTAAGKLNDRELDAVLTSPPGRQALDMLRYTGVGTAQQALASAHAFAQRIEADELMLTFLASSGDMLKRNFRLFSEAWQASQ